MKSLFNTRFDESNLAALLPPPGEGDEILKTPQRHPNEQGLRLLEMDLNGVRLLKRIEAGDFDVVLVLESELLLDGGDKIPALKKAKQVIVLSPYDEGGVSSLAFPVAAFFEKDGTFVNASGVLQKFHKALEPASGVLPASTLLGNLEAGMGKGGAAGKDPQEVFRQMAAAVPALKGMEFESLPKNGVALDLKPLAGEPFRKMKHPRPNVLGGEARP